jgi:transposase
MLALKIFAYKKSKVSIGKYDLINRIVKLKKRENTKWLKDVHSKALQQSIANLDIAYKKEDVELF